MQKELFTDHVDNHFPIVGYSSKFCVIDNPKSGKRKSIQGQDILQTLYKRSRIMRPDKECNDFVVDARGVIIEFDEDTVNRQGQIVFTGMPSLYR